MSIIKHKFVSAVSLLASAAILLSSCALSHGGEKTTSEVISERSSEVSPSTEELTENITEKITEIISEKLTEHESESSSERETESESETETGTETPETTPYSPVFDPIVDDSKAEYTYEELGDDLALLSERYPRIFSYSSIGKSADGKEIYCARIGHGYGYQQVVVTAGIHGREYLMPLVAMSITEFYLANFDTALYQGQTIAEILENVDIYVVPMINPDGIMLSEVGTSSLSDKTLIPLLQTTYELDKSLGWTKCETLDEYLHYNWKANARGVDINRNFPTSDWASLSGMQRPCFRDYKGPSAASEPETQALCSFTETLSNIRAVICLHTQGELIYWLLDRMSGMPSFRTERLARLAADLTGYKFSYESFFDSSYSDWCILNLELPAITVECGRGEYPLPISEYGGALEANLYLWLAAAMAY